MRLIVDLLGKREKDLFLKIDLISNPELIISDSYYWTVFLEIGDENFENLSEKVIMQLISIEIIKYWKNTIEKIKLNEIKYLPIDLSDEYVLFFKIMKTKKGFKMQKILTQEYSGWNLSKHELLKDFELKSIDSIENEFFISEHVIYDGLNWSLAQIKTLLINPTTYSKFKAN